MRFGEISDISLTYSAVCSLLNYCLFFLAVLNKYHVNRINEGVHQLPMPCDLLYSRSSACSSFNSATL